TLSKASNALILCSFLKTPVNLRQNGKSGTNETRTFFKTVVLVTRLKDWNIIPIRRRKRLICFPLNLETSISSNNNSPHVISCMRFTHHNKVDFQAPDKPIILTHSPCSMVKLISDNVFVPLGYFFSTSINLIMINLHSSKNQTDNKFRKTVSLSLRKDRDAVFMSINYFISRIICCASRSPS